MKYGMNLLLWSLEFTDHLLPICDQLKQIGYEGVEIPLFNLGLDYQRIGQQLESMGLQRTTVTIRSEEDNLISPDAKIRAKGVEQNLRAIDCCAAVGGNILVGPLHSAINLFTGQGRTDDEWKWCVDSIRQTAEYAHSMGVRIGIEPLNRFECYFLNSQADTAAFVRDVDHPACGAMCDTFHANIEEKSMSEAIHVTGDKLFHIHISENDRSTPGAGNLNWDDTFDALVSTGYDQWLVVEAFGQSQPEFVSGMKIWRKMFDDEMKLARDGFQFMKSEIEKRTGGS